MSKDLGQYRLSRRQLGLLGLGSVATAALAACDAFDRQGAAPTTATAKPAVEPAKPAVATEAPKAATAVATPAINWEATAKAAMARNEQQTAVPTVARVDASPVVPAGTPKAGEIDPQAKVRAEALRNLLVFSAPVDFRPEAPAGMQNRLVKDWPKGEWNHLMYVHQGKEEVDTYATYWGHNSENMKVQSHGNPGQVIFQMEDTRKQGTLVLAIGTLRNFTDSAGVTKEVWKDKKNGSEAGLRLDLPTAIHLKGIVNAPVYVFNADTKELVGYGAGNQFGDLTIDLPEEGRLVVVAPNLNDPTKTGGVREVNVVAGLDDYYDRQDKDINRIDLSKKK